LSDTDIVTADLSVGTVAVDVTTESLADTDVVSADVAGRTVCVVIASIGLLTDCVLSVTYVPSRTVGIGRAAYAGR
jgi:hypothetical protein